MKKIFAMILLTLALCAGAEAKKQNQIPNLRGIVTDENNAPMEFATVAVISLPDSTILCGGMTDENGIFDIEAPDNASLVQVSMIGYRMVELPVARFTELPTISLRPDAEVLKGAVVSAALPRTEIKGDAVVTNITGSVLEHNGNALDVLGKVPGMINRNGDPEVLGRGTPVYYINGRKVTDNSELRNLMSEDIRAIEVISNPGAVYGGDVRCVVRIRTVRHQGDGFSFALTSQAKQHIISTKEFEPSWSVLDLNYRTKGWDFFGKLVYWNNYNYQISTMHGGTLVNKSGAPDSHLLDGTIDYVGHNGGWQYIGGANWQINENHSLGFKIDYDNNIFGGSDMVFDNDVIINDKVVDHLNSVSIYDIPRSDQWSGNLYYDGNVDKLNINFNADFSYGNYCQDTDTKESSWTSPVELNTTSNGTSVFGAGKLVFTYPIWKGSLQTGVEETYVDASQAYQITLSTIPSTDANLTENTIAGFLQYSVSLPFGQISAGLRYEHVDMTYTDYLVASNNLERHQNNWFPSFNFATMLGPVGVSLSYTGKTVRPNFNMLTNEISYDNRFALQCGDPKLLNEQRRTLSLNANWKWLTFSGNWESVKNRFVQWAYPWNDEGVVMIQYQNLPSPKRQLSLYLNASPNFGVWYPNYTIGVQKQFLTLNLDDPRVAGGKREATFNTPLYFLQANNSFRFKHSWQLEANYQYISPLNESNALVVNPFHTLSFSVQKSFLKDDVLTLRLSAEDVLNKYIQDNRVDYGSYFINQVNDNRRPCILLRVSYRFNSAQSKYKGTGAGQDVKNRF